MSKRRDFIFAQMNDLCGNGYEVAVPKEDLSPEDRFSISRKLLRAGDSVAVDLHGLTREQIAELARYCHPSGSTSPPA